MRKTPGQDQNHWRVRQKSTGIVRGSSTPETSVTTNVVSNNSESDLNAIKVTVTDLSPDQSTVIK